MPIIQQIYSEILSFCFRSLFFFLFIYDVYLNTRTAVAYSTSPGMCIEKERNRKKERKIYVLFVHGDERDSHLEIV
jgi:hypothetical protein